MTRDEPRALLVDFGGVLTSSVHDAFRSFGAAFGDPDLPLRLLAEDPESAALLVAAETGRLRDDDFDEAFGARLAAHGILEQPGGLLETMAGTLRPDRAMLDGLAALRRAGHPVAVVSNSFGSGLYDAYDLPSVADAVVISGEVGIRKPSRRIFAIASERLGVPPERCVLIDDVELNLRGAARLGIEGVLHHDAASTLAELGERFAVASPPFDAPSL